MKGPRGTHKADMCELLMKMRATDKNSNYSPMIDRYPNSAPALQKPFCSPAVPIGIRIGPIPVPLNLTESIYQYLLWNCIPRPILFQTESGSHKVKEVTGFICQFRHVNSPGNKNCVIDSRHLFGVERVGCWLMRQHACEDVGILAQMTCWD
jgi:hypothetical protein